MSGGNAAAGVADANFDVVDVGELLAEMRMRAAFGRGFGGIEQQVHEDLRELIGVGTDVGQIAMERRWRGACRAAWAGAR